MPLPHLAQALKNIIAYLETGDKSQLREAEKNVEELETLIKESRAQTATPVRKRHRR